MKKLLLILFCIPLFTIAQQNDLTYQQAHDITFSKKYKNFTKFENLWNALNFCEGQLFRKFGFPAPGRPKSASGQRFSESPSQNIKDSEVLVQIRALGTSFVAVQRFQSQTWHFPTCGLFSVARV